MRDMASNLPAGWAECRLFDIAEINPPLDRCPFPQGSDVHFVPMPAVETENGRIDISRTRPHDEVRKGYTAFVEGDVLFAKITPCMENGKMAIVPELPASVAFGSTEFHILRCKQGIVPDYLYYFVSGEAFRHEAEHNMTGAVGQKRVPTTFIAEHAFPLPPTREQHRIVAKIEELFSELDKAVESLTLARAQLKTYRQSLLKAAFEGKLTADWRAANPDKLEPPETLLSRIRAEREARYEQALADWDTALAEWRAAGEVGERPSKPKRPEKIVPESAEPGLWPNVPADWRRCSLGELDVHIFDGPFGSNLKSSDYVEAGVRVVRLENIGFGKFINEKKSFISKDKYETIKKHTVRPGDIVFSSFVTDAIRSTIIPETVPAAVNKADCFAIRAFGTRFRVRFLQYFLECRNAFKQVEGMIHGVGRPRINTTQLKEISVPVCSPQEQAEIIDRLERDLSEIDKFDLEVRDQLAHIAVLRQSILKKAFSGQLVPQDPTDEPAAALLARLRQQAPPARTRRRKTA